MKNLTCSILNLLVFFPAFVFSQTAVIRTESFDGTFYPPLGWSAGKIVGFDLNNYTERVTVGSAPVCAPHSGAGMVRYRSGSMFNSGEQSFLASPRFDLTNNPGNAEVSFWMYKDTWNNIRDSVTLYVNDSAVANASKGSMSKVFGPVARDTSDGIPRTRVRLRGASVVVWRVRHESRRADDARRGGASGSRRSEVDDAAQEGVGNADT